MTLTKVLLIAALVCALAPQEAAYADPEIYLKTSKYYTPVKGELELEQWTDIFRENDGRSSYRSRTELEYGITDRLAGAIYFVSGHPVGEAWRYEETKLEMRYRITQPGNRFWDTAAYVELVKPNDSDEPYELEMKAIFSHEFRDHNLTLNLIAGKELEPGAKIEKGYAIGVTPHPKHSTNWSFEVFGMEHEHYVMPAFWFAPGRRQTAAIGLAAGLTGDSDNLQLRTLYLIEF